MSTIFFLIGVGVLSRSQSCKSCTSWSAPLLPCTPEMPQPSSCARQASSSQPWVQETIHAESIHAPASPSWNLLLLLLPALVYLVPQPLSLLVQNPTKVPGFAAEVPCPCQTIVKCESQTPASHSLDLQIDYPTDKPPVYSIDEPPLI